MKPKPLEVLRAHPAWLIMWLLLSAYCEARGDVARSYAQPASLAEHAILNQLTNHLVIDLAGNDTGIATPANRTISGRFFEWLLTSSAAQLGHTGLNLKNVVVAGPVDLSNETVPIQVALSGCQFTDRVVLTRAHFAQDLSFAGCVFDGAFIATGMRVEGSLKLGTASLRRDWMTGSITLPTESDFAQYFATNQNLAVLTAKPVQLSDDADHLTRTWRIEDPRTFAVTNHWTNMFEVTAWGDHLFLVQKNDDVPVVAALGAVNLTLGPLTNQWKLAANGADLDLDFLQRQIAPALDTNLDFIRDYVLSTNAAVSFRSIRWLLENRTNTSVLPLIARWTGAARVSFSRPTVFRSSVVLERVSIGGMLEADEVEFRRNLWCHSLKVASSILMSYTRFNEEAGFIYAETTHDFLLKNSWFKRSFDASGMTVGGSLIIDGTRFGDRADFDVVTVGIDFKGQHVRFENRERLVEFRGLKVDGLVDLQRAQFAGPANFILAHIKGNFQAPGATFGDDHSFQELQNLTSDSFTFNTDFGSMTVDGFAIFENVLFARSVSFRNAQFANLYLDGTHWLPASRLLSYTNDPSTNDLLRLEGMNFDTIRDVTSGHFLHTHAQLEESQTNLLNMFAHRAPYSFDIYAKLEKFFEREGTPGLADKVFVNAKQRERQETTSLPAKAANLFLDLTVGYGRKPLLAFCESLGCIFIWGLLCRHYMVRTSPPKKKPGLGLALFYSLNTFLPIIDLGASDLLEYKRGKESFLYLIAVLKVLGFILVPLWTMALTGLIK